MCTDLEAREEASWFWGQVKVVQSSREENKAMRRGTPGKLGEGPRTSS